MRIRSIWRNPLLGLAAAWVVLAGWLFGSHGWGSLVAVAEACGGPAPDVRFAPSPEITLAFIEGCRARGGVAAYEHLQVLDLVYPAVVAALLALTLRGLARLAGWPRWLAVIPMLASLGDYAENLGAWALISGAKTDGAGPAWAAGVVQAGSFVKVTLSWCAWLIVIALAVRVLARRTAPPGVRPGAPDRSWRSQGVPERSAQGSA